jgi:hypothetical protein
VCGCTGRMCDVCRIYVTSDAVESERGGAASSWRTEEEGADTYATHTHTWRESQRVTGGVKPCRVRAQWSGGREEGGRGAYNHGCKPVYSDRCKPVYNHGLRLVQVAERLGQLQPPPQHLHSRDHPPDADSDANSDANSDAAAAQHVQRVIRGVIRAR